MPNHVTTVCTVSGPQPDIERLYSEHFDSSDGKEIFDFNRIVPAPDIIRESESSTVAEHGAILLLLVNQNPFDGGRGGIRDVFWERIVEAVPDAGPRVPDIARAYLEANPEYAAAGRIRLRCVAETGYSDWYLWNIDHWGTKWSSYEVDPLDVETGEFRFDTAWDFPRPIFEKLVELYPSLTFDCKCFDEGWNFAGQGQFGANVDAQFSKGDATDELYEAVYGEAPVHEDEDA